MPSSARRGSTPEIEWDLYRTFETVARSGSLTRAAKVLGASQSTVSRHLARLEERAGVPLLVRTQPIELTERGRALLAAIGPMMVAALGATDALDVEPDVRGKVKLASVAEVVRWVLAPRLGAFCRTHPQLRLELLASNERVSLASGDADVAVRLARPQKGDLWAKHLGSETYGFFAASALDEGPRTPWLGLAGTLGSIAEQKHAEQCFGDREPRVLVEDVETLGALVEQGLGAAVLPRSYASRLHGVVAVEPARVGARDAGPLPTRDFFLVVHQSRRTLPKVRAVMRWVESVWPRDQRA